MVRKILYAFVAIFVFKIAYDMTSVSDMAKPPSEKLMAPPGAAPVPVAARNVCAPAAIKIKSMDAKFVDECSTRSCANMKGVAVLTNGCAEAVGIQIKIVGLDAKGAPIATRDMWPASTRNIPPGDFTFSLDHWLDHDPRMKSFTLEPIAVRRWR